MVTRLLAALIGLFLTSSGAADLVPGGSLELVASARHGDRPVREPMVVMHPDGDLFLAGYRRSVDPNMSPQLWRSRDGGASWQLLDVGSVEEGARGNSDVDLAVGEDGTLYFVVMGYDRSALEGVHVVIGASSDRGDHWRWTTLAQQQHSDRPWVEVAPDGVAHVIWNDGEGVRHASSTDRGHSWQERPRISDRGGSSHLAIGPAGELAVRIVPISAAGRGWHADTDFIAVSEDGGHSWVSQTLPTPVEWSENLGADGKLPRWVEPIAWDDRGSLHYLWSEGSRLKLASSEDRGATWRTRLVHEESATAYFPYLIARGDGELAASWFVGTDDALAVRIAHIVAPAADAAAAGTRLAELFQQPAWLEQNGRERRDTGGEYLPLLWLDSAQLATVAVAQRGNGDRVNEARGPDGENQQGFVWRVYRVNKASGA